MYSYAWDMVSAQRLIQLAATDNFTSTDIFAELFLINVNQVLHRGLQHQYVEYTADLNCARGRIDFVETMTKLKSLVAVFTANLMSLLKMFYLIKLSNTSPSNFIIAVI